MLFLWEMSSLLSTRCIYFGLFLKKVNICEYTDEWYKLDVINKRYNIIWKNIVLINSCDAHKCTLSNLLSIDKLAYK